mmetsp:Transcript_26946/g.78209  ORF Transcript_26946/g.78209 Transcript_26946/m.78209 type:complete len:205 (+) Transcript_26946:1095-1709(+)
MGQRRGLHFGRDVFQRAHGLLHVRGVAIASEPPIDDFDVVEVPPKRVQANVFGLQVAVHNSAAMDELQCASDLPDNIRGHLLSEGAPADDDVVQIAVLAEFHDHRHARTFVASLQKPADVGMVKFFQQLHLVSEDLFVAKIGRGDLLDRDLPAWHHDILCKQDAPTSAGAHFSEDMITALDDVRPDILRHQGLCVEDRAPTPQW